MLAPGSGGDLDVTDDQPVPLPLHERRAAPLALPSLSGLAQESATGLAGIYNAAKALIRAEPGDEAGVDIARASG